MYSRRIQIILCMIEVALKLPQQHAHMHVTVVCLLVYFIDFVKALSNLCIVSIQCTDTKGNPKSEISWFQNGIELDFKDGNYLTYNDGQVLSIG